jgi:iron complex transport system substrate-binding protein
MLKPISAIALVLLSATARAETVVDDAGQKLTLNKAAMRVISLSPHGTELLFAAGGGAQVVGVLSYSDFPEAAKSLPNVGDNNRIDLERIVALKPDLLVVWRHGSPERQIEQLKKLGIPIFHSEPGKLDDIPDNVQKLGRLLGTSAVADKVAQQLRTELSSLRSQYAHQPPVRVFYQVWDKPLYTLNGVHIVSDALRVCGGENIFATQKILAPQVSVEAVLQENPEVIFASAEQDSGGFRQWRAFPKLLAVKNNNLMSINGTLLNRAGPRMIAGTAALCQHLDTARQHRKN